MVKLIIGSSAQSRVGDLKSNSIDGQELTTSLDCLTRNGYNEARCQSVIRNLYECCEAFYERHGEDASSPSCPKPNLLKLKMKQLREEQGK